VTTPWVPLLGADPVPWLLDGEEAAARWLTLTATLGRSDDDPDVRRAHAAVLTAAATRDLLDRLPDWEAGAPLSGHESPAFAPNLLNLLADMGVRGGDDLGIEKLLDRMLEHQEDTDRFPSYGGVPGADAPVWGALLCDSHVITEVLVRYGRGDDPRVLRALARMGADLADTAQGRAWPCLPHSVTGWRGPGRRGDVCPQVTVEALRTFGRVPEHRRPPGVLDAARVTLRAWRMRGAEKPYMFGHGRQYKTVKWPPTWYGAMAVLDALAGFPALWRDAAEADPDRRSLAELLACLVAYNVDDRGRVVPGSAFRGFQEFSFGQKKAPSPFATARLLATLAPFDELTGDAAAVDVSALGSSKGGSGTVVPPRRHGSPDRPRPGPRTGTGPR
jgi:hypothetical protein